MRQVAVKFKYGKDKAVSIGNWSGSVDGNTESSVLAKLRKVFTAPQHKVIELVEVKWK